MYACSTQEHRTRGRSPATAGTHKHNSVNHTGGCSLVVSVLAFCDPMLHCTYSCSPDRASGTSPKLTTQRREDRVKQGRKGRERSCDTHRLPTALACFTSLPSHAVLGSVVIWRVGWLCFVGNEFPNLSVKNHYAFGAAHPDVPSSFCHQRHSAELGGFPTDVVNMAGEGVSAAGYGSDEFESSIASEVSTSSGQEAEEVVKRTKPATSSDILPSADLGKKQRPPGGDSKHSTVQGQTSSASIRQAVYNEWCRSKEKRLAEQQRKEATERLAMEKIEKEEKENFKVKCKKAVEDWHARKKEQSVKLRKEELNDKGRCVLYEDVCMSLQWTVTSVCVWGGGTLCFNSTAPSASLPSHTNPVQHCILTNMHVVEACCYGDFGAITLQC